MGAQWHWSPTLRAGYTQQIIASLPLQPHVGERKWLNGCFTMKSWYPASAVDLADGQLQLLLLFISTSISSVNPQPMQLVWCAEAFVPANILKMMSIDSLILTTSLDYNFTKTNSSGLLLFTFIPLKSPLACAVNLQNKVKLQKCWALWKPHELLKTGNQNTLDNKHFTG